MDTKLRQLMSDEELEFFSHLTRLCPEGMIPLARVKLTEFVFPLAEYGTDLFYHDFKELNKITVPFFIYSFKKKKPVCVIYYLKDNQVGFNDALEIWLENCQISLFKINSVKDLYLNDDLINLLD
ncbi:excisionase [Salmonella enterica subsp. enterica serovar Newport]|nr:excisionase [Salmonella enterica subsp. enterica serovar Newport]EAY0943276.1 excisionase [Salmonella enterica]EBS2367469.1 excisionase [Salmonella enterica subsp. enterica serovar Newport]EBS4398840.1 excisionase [Salmonella enterica subsp. enterica serovar Newport]EBY9582882.1 excisionase [Salmonella enterica subsp. enterica serovar Newport]